ncbi:DMT family transporter [Teredinibacter sp. KSP-S5-2]|uniref:DMT family transporter n=1 Tax=Teredinibacter sp. KSP-S5-2 TaxID=3034506 RepID=UPI002934221E|nr:DMT family transporter [Teredinibacter sp. KSP-S5-2]WNO07926.1 DMT family transporter [Teredinibacter sp. KSP-S5-2]
MAASVRYISTDLPLPELAFFRSVIPMAIVGILILQQRKPFFPSPRKPLLLRGILGTGGLLCFFHATQNLPMSVSGILVWCTPAVTYVTARLALGEKLGIKTLQWLLVAAFGLLLIFSPVWFADIKDNNALAQVNFVDFSIGLMGTLFAGMVFVTIRSAAANHTNYSIVFSFSVTASIITGAWMMTSFVMPNHKLWGILIVIGVTGTLAQLALTEAYRNAPAALVSSMGLMQAPFAIAWGVFMFAEQLTALHLIGIVLMGIGVALASRAHARE